MQNPLMAEIDSVRMDKWNIEDAEKNYQIRKIGGTPCQKQGAGNDKTNPQQQKASSPSSLVSEIAKARQHIQKSLNTEKMDENSNSPVASSNVDNIISSRLENLELENKDLKKVTEDLQAVVKQLEKRIAALEAAGASSPTKASEKPVSKKEEVPEQKEDDDDDDDDDDIDLFEDDVDEEAEKVRQERLKAYHEKKSKKPGVIAKSNVILDVKPWGDDTDMVALEKSVRSIEMDGLLWGTSKLQAVGYGIKKLTISTVVEDEKVSIEDLTDQIEAFDDYVQSVDIAAFNKI